MNFKDFVGEFLSFIERQEAKLLSWGFYNGSFDTSQIEDWLASASATVQQAWSDLLAEGYTTSDLIEKLCEERLLHAIPGTPGRYRSRFAEGVRLIAGLRQLFPGHSWATAPRLVSDIRMDLAPRCYPMRDISADECWSAIESVCASGSKELLRRAFYAMATQSGGKRMCFSGFQVRAFMHLFQAYGKEMTGGSIISAGTGSGKTKAFYVPTFLRVIEDVARDARPSTKVIAIYPRNVLLADQLREALSEAAKLRDGLGTMPRPITFGALLGDTPYAEDFRRQANEGGRLRAEVRHWRRLGNGFVVPFLKSPTNPKNDLIWRDIDRSVDHTPLYDTADGTRPEVPDGVLRLTREQLQRLPPDVLFLSAEMLNRELGNTDWAPAFGVGRGKSAPRLVLLDEVHTYQDVQGAQIAWLLRRWRHWSRSRSVHFVGLSATLADAPSHLSRVVGIPPATVIEFRPESAELDYRGIEYNLSVKGNPAGASLLATSIQTGMLVSRLLAPPQSPDAGPDGLHGNAFFGRKTFGFTDNLDTLNRWLADMSHAERQHLARLRMERQALAPVERARLYQDGQLWDMCREIGHNLDASLRVSGCSSQRPGFNSNSDLVIATSSLEVGFDDPEVGAIVHHKRPSSMASFVQRKGRAGRRPHVRPWTVVVLSDYAADRYMFHNSERLFRPEIETIFLPVCNPYVLRQQAVYFLMDWLGQQVREGGPFAYLRPFSGASTAQRKALNVLRGLLEQGPLWYRFRDEFEKLFSGGCGSESTESQVDAILWAEPRPLLLEVVPALIRRLEVGWAQADPQLRGAKEDAAFTRPLPDFIPAATFSQLDIAELTLRFTGDGKDQEHLTVGQGLREFCPGRVSKRYSTADKEPGYWVVQSSDLITADDDSRHSVREFYADLVLLENVESAGKPILVYQPLTAELTPQAPQITERSNAQWDWHSKFRLIGEGTPLPVPRSGIWKRAVLAGEAHLHRDQTGIEILRYAHKWEYSLVRTKPKGSVKRGIARLGVTDQGQDVDEAVGFRVKADGLRWVIPSSYLSDLAHPCEHDVNRLRSDFFLHQLRACPHLARYLDFFSAEWIHRTSSMMLVGTALRQRCSLAQAQSILTNHRASAARKILQEILPAASDEDEAPDAQAKLRDNLIALWSEPEVIRQVVELEACLWAPLGSDFDSWMKSRFLSALAQAFRSAAVSQVQGVSESDLLLDVFWEGGDAEILLTEESSGGLGHAEAVVAAMRRVPESFPEGVRHAVTFCPRQNTATALFEFLRLLMREPNEGPLHRALTGVRSAVDFRALADAGEALKSALWNAGLDADRSLVVALVGRFARPGSSSATDRLAYVVNALWRKHTAKLGIPIDSAVWAYFCATFGPARRRFASVLRGLSGGHSPSGAQIYRLVQQMLLETCEDSCPECLGDRNQYNDAGPASRTLAAQWFAMAPPQVVLEANPEWQSKMRECLSRHGAVDLRCQPSNSGLAMTELQSLLAEELEVDCMLVPPMVTSIRRIGTEWCISLQLRGMVA